MLTGMRTGENFALRWDNVDLAKGAALVREALVRGEEKSSTKTGVARTVHLNSRALGALARQRELSEAPAGRVFLDPRYGLEWAEERSFRRSYWEPMKQKLAAPKE